MARVRHSRWQSETAHIMEDGQHCDLNHLATHVSTIGMVGKAPLDFCKVVRWIKIVLADDAVFPVFVAGEVVYGIASRSCPSYLSLDTQQILAHLHSHVSHFTPILPPRISDDPKLGTSRHIGAPSHDANNVVGLLVEAVISEDTARVSDNGLSVDCCRDRASAVDLSHDLVTVALIVVRVKVDQPILGHSSVREVVDFCTGSAHACKSITSLANSRGSASSVYVLAETFI